MAEKEARPPWVVYPENPPWDSFWKYGGEPYMNVTFRPFWNSLKDEEKRDYLKRWNVTEEWLAELDPDIDPEVKEFLDKLYYDE